MPLLSFAMERTSEERIDWLRLAQLVFGVCLVYAVLRYHVLKEVAWDHFPVFIFNKALSLTATAMLALSFWPRQFASPGFIACRRELGICGFSLAAVHAGLSVLILRPSYFPGFFDGLRLNFHGELAMLTGVLGMVTFAGLAFLSLRRDGGANRESVGGLRLERTLGLWALGAVGVHVFARGIEGWVLPATWPAGLPPISLIGFLAVVLPLAARLALAIATRKSVAPKRLDTI